MLELRQFDLEGSFEWSKCTTDEWPIKILECRRSQFWEHACKMLFPINIHKFSYVVIWINMAFAFIDECQYCLNPQYHDETNYHTLLRKESFVLLSNIVSANRAMSPCTVAANVEAAKVSFCTWSLAGPLLGVAWSVRIGCWEIKWLKMLNSS